MPGCLAHCKDLAHAHAGRTRTPFASTCWKGIREIIVKLARDGVVSAVLFAGAWRTARSAPETDVPKLDQARELHRTLPLWDQTRGLKLARHLTTWGQGLMQLLDSFRWDIGTSRSAIIRRFIARCAHRPTSLAELANELGCPVSRADHIVVEELGTSFRELLQNERIDRAKFLLSSGPGSLADVAEACGFRNEYSFNRVFTRNVGMPPGRWRKGQVTGP
jgi:AraC-like DNA-binding protein